MTAVENIAAKRGRLAALDATVARLKVQYDLLMNAFKFDEAKALVAGIEAAERERAVLAAELPPAPAEAPPAPYAVARRCRR